MGKKFVFTQSNFSLGQVSKDYDTGISEQVNSKACLEAKNCIIDNGTSTRKRPGTRLIKDIVLKFRRVDSGNLHTFDFTDEFFTLDKSSDNFLKDSDDVKVLRLLNKTILICKFGIFEEKQDSTFVHILPEQSLNIGDFFPSGPYYISRGVRRIHGNNGSSKNESPKFSAIENTSNGLNFISTDDSPEYFTGDPFDESVQQRRVDAIYFPLSRKDLLLMKVTNADGVAYIHYDRDKPPIMISKSIKPLFDPGLDEDTFSCFGLFHFMTYVLLRSNKQFGFTKHGTIVNSQNFIDFYKNSLPFTATQGLNNRFFTMSRGSNNGVININIDEDSITSQLVLGKALLVNIGTFRIILYPHTIGDTSGVYHYYLITPDETLNVRESQLTIFKEDGTLKDGLRPLFYVCDWARGSYPTGISSDSGRTHFFLGNTVWSSSTRHSAEFFSYDEVIDTNRQLPNNAKKRNYSEIEIDESIQYVVRTNELLIFTDRQIYQNRGDLPTPTKFSEVSNIDTSSATPIVLDSSVFCINTNGDLIRIFYNFNESAFTESNLSKKLRFNGLPSFTKILHHAKLYSYIFLLGIDKRIYCAYYTPENKTMSWSYFDIKVKDFHIKNNGRLEIVSVDNKILQLPISYTPNRVYLDIAKTYFIFDELNINKDSIEAEINKDYAGVEDLVCYSGSNVNDLYPLVWDSSTSSFSGFPSFPRFLTVGLKYSYKVKLMTLSTIDSDGNAINKQNRIDSIQLRMHDSYNPKVDVNGTSISPKVVVGDIKKPVNFIDLESFNVNNKNIEIEISHDDPSYFKLLGLTVRGNVED